MTSPVTNTGKQTPSDTIRTIREALEDCCSTMIICARDGNANVRQEEQQCKDALVALSMLEASLKAEEPRGRRR